MRVYMRPLVHVSKFLYEFLTAPLATCMLVFYGGHRAYDASLVAGCFPPALRIPLIVRHSLFLPPRFARFFVFLEASSSRAVLLLRFTDPKGGSPNTPGACEPRTGAHGQPSTSAAFPLSLPRG